MLPRAVFCNDGLCIFVSIFCSSIVNSSILALNVPEFIVDSGHGMGFSLGNILKYAQRYGKKNGHDKNDLMKVLHYGIIALHVHNLNNEESETNEYNSRNP